MSLRFDIKQNFRFDIELDADALARDFAGTSTEYR
jgi:hypothetical protein